ncbi:MAG: hypothetical protein ABIP61_17110 [Burkholderiaceae bacterium]
MTTTTLHLDVERARFAKHALTAVESIWSGAVRALSRPAPALAEPPTHEQIVREAHRVRELARRYANTDPGFASDLFAAASRHEESHGV